MAVTVAPDTHDPLPGTLQARAPVQALDRTTWHSHVVGQTLYATEGKELFQSRGGNIKEIHASDAIQTPAEKCHWHGADPDRFMTHPPSSKPSPATNDRSRAGQSTVPTTSTTIADTAAPRARCTEAVPFGAGSRVQTDAQSQHGRTSSTHAA